MKRPRDKSTVKMTDDGITFCAECKAELLCDKYGQMPNYCPECGRELDWTEFIRITTESDEPEDQPK